MKSFDPSFLECVRQRQITGVCAGKERSKFTGIWMVVIADRIFARPYFMAERSWYNTFLFDKHGSIRCGNTQVAVAGVKARHDDHLMESINESYSRKYGLKESNNKWITGLAHPDRVARTIEFLPA